MSVRTRIETIRLIEKMERHEAYSKKLGLSEVPKLHGKIVGNEREIRKRGAESRGTRRTRGRGVMNGLVKITMDGLKDVNSVTIRTSQMDLQSGSLSSKDILKAKRLQ